MKIRKSGVRTARKGAALLVDVFDALLRPLGHFSHTLKKKNRKNCPRTPPSEPLPGIPIPLPLVQAPHHHWCNPAPITNGGMAQLKSPSTNGHEGDLQGPACTTHYHWC